MLEIKEIDDYSTSGWRKELENMRNIRLKIQDEFSNENMSANQKIWMISTNITKILDIEGIILKTIIISYKVYLKKNIRNSTFFIPETRK